MLVYLPVPAEKARQLSWEDMIPAIRESDDPFANMTQDQKDLAIWVIFIRESLLDSVEEDRDGLIEELKNATRELEDIGIDIDQVIEKRNKNRASVVEGLNGQWIRIPGYLLPLEMPGSKVTEFLLVPYIGACIHVPPPPPNQIIYVKIVQNQSYQSKNLYDPVWVTGVITAKSMEKNLYLVDGSADVDVGYSIQANIIEPYKE